MLSFRHNGRMKHAGMQALAQLAALLGNLRRLGQLAERAPGTFYLRSRAVLHFHEDPLGLFADMRTAGDWERFPVNTREEQNVLLQRLRAWLASAERKAVATPKRRS
jgi:hypothetical protein